MTSLANRGHSQPDGPLVVAPDGRTLGRADLRAGVSARIAPTDRVALSIRSPLDFIATLAALDGQVDAVLLLSYSFPPDTVAALAGQAGCTVIVSDREDIDGAIAPQDVIGTTCSDVRTGWLMTTSGTTGLPKIVPHTLDTLSRSVYRFKADAVPVWGMIYDPTRFAGMQVLLQALVGGGRLLLAEPGAPLQDQVAFLAKGGCTHLSATPTLWRRILMVPGHADLPLRQATMGGEIADQQTLGAVRAAFPEARLTHIYASTEAGVGFSVTDERAGFPASYLETAPANVAMDIRDDILWLRPPGESVASPSVQRDEAGFICSGDRVQVQGDRVQFLGRDNGMMNIGGVKVFPETVENVLLTVPDVALAKVSSKRNPVTGALVVAEILLVDGADPDQARARILETSRAHLVREAVPAIIRFVSGFETNAAGKLVRSGG